ncbi:MAG: AAA family ATPase [Clostridiales bacterium]|nr:AAA family ATPase [Clostridiales bacterium]
MKRNATQELINWNHNKNRKPLIVWGARQVGKTYLVKDIFAENYYKNNYIYIDCKIEDEIVDFCTHTANAGKIIEYISLFKGKKISERTLLIFDEVQECPNIISALKYFCQDFRQIPVIATGSMVRIKIQRETHKRGGSDRGKFLFPVGKINQITIYPMTFDEFLMNANEVLYEAVKKAYENKVPLSPKVHGMAMDMVYKYLLVGGMPEAAAAYIEEDDLFESREILKVLYDNYLSDMELYQASREAVLRSRNLFSNIYRELNRESKNFSPGLIEGKSKTRDFATSIQWLTMAHVINQSFQLKEHITMPLMADNVSNFRLFLGDIGMFSYQSGINAASFLSTDKENTLSGIFFENYIANELTAKGHRLFYWRGRTSSEIEFIVESDNKLYPIDVKKGRGILNSLTRFGDHNRFECAIKVSKNNYGYDAGQKLLTLPFYLFPFAAGDLQNGNPLI